MVLLILTSIIAVLVGLILYSILLKMGKDYYPKETAEQIREQKILRGFYGNNEE